MKVSYLYLLLSASWLSSVLAGESKGTRMSSFRNLKVEALDKKAAADVTEIASTETRTRNHEYASSDFEYISSLPSKKSKKSSKKGKGGSKSSKKGITASVPVVSEPVPSPTVSPTLRPTAVDEVVFGLEEFSLYYIPSGQEIRFPTTLENSELLDATGLYIDWFFKTEYPSSFRTDLRVVVTEYEGDNEFVPNQPIKKTFQSQVIFEDSSDLPTRTELEETLELAFNEQNINSYMEFLNGPYPPPPDDPVAELSDQNIFKGATAYVQQPSLSTAESTTSVTGIMIAAAAVGFTLLVAGIAICKKKSDEQQQVHARDLEKRTEEATIAAETLTVAADTIHSGRSVVSPLSFHSGERDEERGSPQCRYDDLLLLPAWDEETIREDEMENVSTSADSSPNCGGAQGDRKALSDWRRQRDAEHDPIQVDSFDSFDEQTLSDSSASSDASPSQQPKSVAELTSLLSSRLPTHNDMEDEEYEEEVVEDEYEEEVVEDEYEDEIQIDEDDVNLSNRPKTVKELQEMLFAGGTVVKRGNPFN